VTEQSVAEQQRAERFARRGLTFAISIVFLLLGSLYVAYGILFSIAMNFD
jgi:hypothetical protein